MAYTNNSAYSATSVLEGTKSAIDELSVAWEMPTFEMEYKPLKPLSFDIEKYRSIYPDGASTPPSIDKEAGPWYQDGDIMGGYAGLASALTGLLSYKENKKTAELQRKGLTQDIAFMKENQTFTRNARANINKPRTAFA